MVALLNSWAVAALVVTLIPIVVFGFAGEQCTTRIESLSPLLRLTLPAIAALPYLLVSIPYAHFHWLWLLVYSSAPVLVSTLLWIASKLDPEQRSLWLDFLVLAALGLAVDLRWLESAWPPRLAVIGKLLLLDAGLYGFLAIRKLTGVGFDLRLRTQDW